MTSKFFSAVSVVLLTVAWASTAIAEAWPTKPVKVIVASAPGSGPDTLTRYIGTKLSQALGQTVVVENRPGANSVIGVQTAARAAPDGYTFLLATSGSFSVNRATVKGLPYDPLKDFTPVALLATGGLVMVANGKTPFNTIADVVAFDKAQPGKLSVSTEGPVAATILAYLNEYLGTKLLAIPHTQASVALQEVMSGRTELSIASVILSVPHVKSGDLRALAVTTPKRDPSLPNVPTVGETAPGFGVNAWVMLVAPAGVPAPIIQKLNVEINRILADAEVRQWMGTFGNRPEGGTSAAASEFLRTDAALWEKIARAAGTKPQ